MRMSALAVHIIAGALGIVLGFVALFTAKGAHIHRTSGMRFVYAMMTMALIGATMAVVWDVAPAANAPVGMLTAYLVITGLITVRPPTSGWHRLDLGLMLVALSVGLALFTFGFRAVASPNGKMSGMPSFPFFIFGSVALLATVGDLRMIRSGGTQAMRGTRRLARHLWRMCFALLIAAFSFFLGQAKVIPKPIRIIPLLIIPPLVVLATMLYWLWRVRVRRTYLGIASVSAPGGIPNDHRTGVSVRAG
ncbi:MAG: hypothetical protein ABI877_06985 [Gemmatimonadaceae bacterium]